MEPLSESALKQAAINYCQMMNLDPYKQEPVSPGLSPGGITYDVCVWICNWEMVMERLREQDRAMVALFEARQQEAK